MSNRALGALLAPLALALPLMLLLASACADANDDADLERAPTESLAPAAVAARLDEVLPAIVEEDLIWFQDDSCRRLETAAGHFVAGASFELCIQPHLPDAVRFDDARVDADGEFERIRDRFDVGRTALSSVEVLSGGAPGGEPRVRFVFAYSFGREVFVHDPGYALPRDDPGERWYEEIDDDWYWVRIDWS